MGAWGPGSFENDDALDWLNDLSRGHGTTPIRDALSAAAESDAYVETPEASAAIAAAEIVAALLGHPSARLPEEAAGWVRAHRSLGSAVDARHGPPRRGPRGARLGAARRLAGER